MSKNIEWKSSSFDEDSLNKLNEVTHKSLISQQNGKLAVITGQLLSICQKGGHSTIDELNKKNKKNNHWRLLGDSKIGIPRNENTKKKYELLASEDKDRYLREKSAAADGGASESKEVEPVPEVVVEAPVPESAPAPKKKATKKKKADAVVEEPVLVPEPVPESAPAPAPVAKKTGNNGYINYSKLMRASVSAETGLDFKGTTGELSKRWKALSDDDKQKYKEGSQVSA
jgi:hypothetical protein